MRILFLSNWYPYPANNGARLRTFNLLRQLGRRHDIALLSFVRADLAGRVEREPVEALCQVLGTAPYPSNQLSRLQGLRQHLSPRPRSLAENYSPEMEAKLGQALAQERFDLIIASEISTGTGISAYITGQEGIPCVLEDLELSMIRSKIQSAQNLTGRYRHRLTWWKLKTYSRQHLQKMAGCTVASEEEKALVQGCAPDGLPLAVVPNGVDLEAYTGDWGKPEPDTLVFSGALSYSANWMAMDYFLGQVFPTIKVQRPGLTLRITGGTKGVELDRLPQQDGVIFTGYLDDIRPAISQSWASVVPLLQGGGTRLKILEAMALGTPVVSTSKGAEGLSATPGEEILIADGPAELAQTVQQLLESAELRNTLATNGLRLVRERYSWETCAQALDQLLYQVLERGNRRA